MFNILMEIPFTLNLKNTTFYQSNRTTSKPACYYNTCLERIPEIVLKEKKTQMY